MLGVLQSHFNPVARRLYLQSPKPPCQVYKSEPDPELPRGDSSVSTHLAVDIIRSRYSALYEAIDLPVFSVLDDVEEVEEGKLPDLAFIDTGRPIATDVQSHLVSLPYCGPGWYCRPAIEYMLHTKRVSWSDIKFGIKASGRFPGDRMRETLDLIDNIWSGVVNAGENVDHNGNPSKYCVNAWVGYCGMNAKVNLKTRLSFERLDGDWTRQCFDTFGIPGLREYEKATVVMESGTFRPIYDYALSVEHVRIAQAHQACQATCKDIRRSLNPLSINTDGFIFPKQRNTVTVNKFKMLLESLTAGDLPNLEDRIRALLHQAEPLQKRLKTNALFPISGRKSERPVFRVVVPQGRQILRGKYEHDKVTMDYKLTYNAPVWTPVENVLEHLLAGNSLAVFGIAGVGKSYMITKCVEALEEKGKRVIPIAKTHVAAEVAQGVTADSFAYRHIREGGTSADIVWVDEISMLGIDLLKELNHLSLRPKPVQFILSGDFNQFSPMFDNFMGEPVRKEFEGSSLLHSLAGGNFIELTECRRSDPELFGDYSAIVKGGTNYNLPLAQQVAFFRGKYTEDKATGFIPGSKFAPTNLVISHELREQINRQCNLADAVGRLNTVEFSIDIATRDVCQNKPQDFIVWTGMSVVAATTSSSGKYKNGRRYTIQEINDMTVVLRRDDHTFELKRGEFIRSMRLCYAFTYQSCQGITVDGLLALHNTDHYYFNGKMMYVGVSRATGSDKLIVY